jgi:hypothetical protein
MGIDSTMGSRDPQMLSYYLLATACCNQAGPSRDKSIRISHHPHLLSGIILSAPHLSTSMMPRPFFLSFTRELRDEKSNAR